MERTASRRTSPPDRSRIAAASSRARITNGRALVAGADGRSREMRRLRDIYHGLLDRTGGRNDALVRSLASMILLRERLDSRLARCEVIDSTEMTRIVGAISRLTTKLGLVEEAPPEDGTQDAIRALRANRDEARPA